MLFRTERRLHSCVEHGVVADARPCLHMPAFACVYTAAKEKTAKTDNALFSSPLGTQDRAFFDFLVDGTLRLVRRPCQPHVLRTWMRLSHADGRLFSRSGPCGGTGTRTTGRPRCDSALAGGTCVVGEENSRGQVLCRGPWSCPARCVSPNGPGNKTPPTPAASTPRRQHQQHDDDTTRPIAAAALAPHLAIAMPQHHRHRQPSHPGSGTSQVTAWSAA